MGLPFRCSGFASSSSSSSSSSLLLPRASLGDLGEASAKASRNGPCWDGGLGNSELRHQPLLIHSAATSAASFSTSSSSSSSSSFSSSTLHDPIAIPAHPCHEAEAALLSAATKEKAEAEAKERAAANDSDSSSAAVPPCSAAAATAATSTQNQKPAKRVVRWQDGGVPLEAKERLLQQRACVIWLTGLPASGKSAVAAALERQLGERGRATALLDGDNVRHGLCADLGFSPEDRAENVRRVGEAARLLSCGGGGLLAIAALVSPYRAHRDAVRASLPPGRFVEVFVDAPLSLCERRDPKGLYRAARAGELRGMTGLDAPYEKPESPEVTVRPCEATGGPGAAAAEVVRFLEERGLIPPPAVAAE